mmetsp:Transcript_48663/g.35828  ORF Transcript_48663/g.35828 Transcript_48663/m.35828 type:complete len:206 (+) Transcript_48663:116-733(+)
MCMSVRERSTMGSGWAGSETALESWSGEMGRSMRESGGWAGHKGMENSFTPRGKSMKEAGSMTKLRERESTDTAMELLIPATGTRTYSMGMVRRSGLTSPCSRESTSRERSSVSGSTCGRTGQPTKASGKRTRSRASASTNGQTVVGTSDSGRRTLWIRSGTTSGTMDDSMKDSMWRTRRRALECTLGPTGRSLPAGGRTASSMA